MPAEGPGHSFTMRDGTVLPAREVARAIYLIMNDEPRRIFDKIWKFLANVVNLMEALRQSVQAAGGKQPRATRTQSKKGRKRIEGQREMLLPIPGKKDKEAAAKSSARPSGRHRKTG
jgi:hypothetical protein